MKANRLSTSLSPQASLLTPPMSVQERLTKARAAKAVKRLNSPPVGVKRVKLSVIDLPLPAQLRQHRHQVAVQVGERGGHFYVNKNGNRTYLSSNE